MWNPFKKKPKFKVGDIIAMEYRNAEAWESKRSDPIQIIEISPTAYKTIDKYGLIGTVKIYHEYMFIELIPVEPVPAPSSPPQLRVIK